MVVDGVDGYLITPCVVIKLHFDTVGACGDPGTVWCRLREGDEVVVDGVDGYLITPCVVVKLHFDTVGLIRTTLVDGKTGCSCLRSRGVRIFVAVACPSSCGAWECRVREHPPLMARTKNVRSVG